MQVLERILYAEDDPDIQQVAVMALEMVGGFTLKTCASGLQGFRASGLQALAEIEAFEPQLLLLDVMMPDMDGPSVLEKIREIEIFRATPAVFMTAKVQPDEVQAYLDMGAVAVIAKPFDPMTLASQIQAIWDKTLS